MALQKIWTQATVRAIADPADGVRLIELVPAGGAKVYPLGSHIDLDVLIDEKPAIRSYSLVGEAPVDNAWRIAVKRLADSRGGSRYMWSLKPGARLKVALPTSHFELVRGRPDYLLIAGGIGITPILGMAQALHRTGASFRLLYAARERTQLAFGDELRELLGDRLELYVDAENRFIDLTAEVARLHAEAELYICGPIGLMEAAKRVWATSKRSPNRLRLETFGSSGHRPAEAFTVTVRDYGREVSVARDQTLADALFAQGIDVPRECLRGECGLCTVDIVNVAGDLDHRDIFLSAAEKAEAQKLCACVSRAIGHLTIDTGYRPGLVTSPAQNPRFNPAGSA